MAMKTTLPASQMVFWEEVVRRAARERAKRAAGRISGGSGRGRMDGGGGGRGASHHIGTGSNPPPHLNYEY